MRTLLATIPLFLLSTTAARGEVLEVGLRGSFWVEEQSRGHGYRALLEVTVGWEALLFGRRGGHVPSDTVVSEDAAPEALPEPSAPAPHEPLARASLEVRPAWLKPSLATDLVKVVLERGRAGESRAASLATRSRTRAVLPVLRLSAGRGSDQSLRYSPTLDDPDRWLVSGGADLNYEAQATWTLDRLVFADDEVAIERLREQSARARGLLAMRALKVLFAWQAARVRLTFQVLEPDQVVLAQLEALQAQSELDVLTGGWFTRQLVTLGIAD